MLYFPACANEALRIAANVAIGALVVVVHFQPNICVDVFVIYYRLVNHYYSPTHAL